MSELLDTLQRWFVSLPHCATLGFEFIGTYGELGVQGNPAADRNYRAQTAWARNPALAPEDFA